MIRKVSLWLAVLFLLIGMNQTMLASAQNTEVSFRVDKQKYDKYNNSAIIVLLKTVFSSMVSVN